MTFDYLRTVQSLDTISIEDIGNTCINAINDDAQEWFLILETKDGWTKTTSFGPLKVDSNKLNPYFNYEFFEREFSDKNISKTIDKFINNPKHSITQVFEVDKKFAQERFSSIKECL